MDIVADDWGLSPGVNEGILDLARRGVVRGVSLLANLDGATHGLDELLCVPGLRFSLHLNLTLGRPLAPRSPLAEGGAFPTLNGLLAALALGRVPAEALAEEAALQARRLLSLGVPLSGVEGHHHVHLLPAVAGAAGPVLRGEGVRWARLPVDPGHPPSRLLAAVHRRSRHARAYGDLVPMLYLRPEDLLTEEALERKTRSGRDVIAHPAAYDDIGSQPFPDSLRERRVREYLALRELAHARV